MSQTDKVFIICSSFYYGVENATKGKSYEFREIKELDPFLEKGYIVKSITTVEPTGQTTANCMQVVIHLVK